MRKKTILTLSVIAALLGASHTALTALIYPSWSLDALWFLGAGLAMMLAAAINFLAYRSLPQAPRAIAVVTNAAMAGFFGSAWPLLPAPQVALGGAVFVVLTVVWLWRPQSVPNAAS